MSFGKIFWTICFLAVVSLFLYFYDFPQKIDLAYPAVEYRVGVPDSAEQTAIRIKGIIKRPLFRKPTFHGHFIVDKYEYTGRFELWPIDLHVSPLLYPGNDKGKPFMETLGALYIEGSFTKLNIWVFEQISETYRGTDNLRISAPADNYEEAMLINKEMGGSFK